ncbi:MAG: zinc ribbon domain-containing protein [Acidobacteria bacterium]|nr:zinc ribbon domain-containing protein [Acidobacteriota bacterium]
MPLFEYICRDCGHAFEALVTASRLPSCPSCESQALEKQLSVFALSTKSRDASPAPVGACGACGDPRGPGACSMN